ncbi:MAG: DUF1491 family protein [Hyphomicrobium sp.]
MRLKSEIWVKAYLRRCQVNGAPGVVVRHGDDDAGAIFIKIVRADRTAAVFSPAPAGLDDADIDRRWVSRFKTGFVPDEEAEALLKREAAFDSDIWVIEIEDRDGRDFLGDELMK